MVLFFFPFNSLPSCTALQTAYFAVVFSMVSMLINNTIKKNNPCIAAVCFKVYRCYVDHVVCTVDSNSDVHKQDLLSEVQMGEEFFF